MEDPSEETLDEVCALEIDAVQEFRRKAASLSALPDVKLPAEKTEPFDFSASDLSSINLQPLVEMRYRHQTKQAASGVRNAKKYTGGSPFTGSQRTSESSNESESDVVTTPTVPVDLPNATAIRQELTRELELALKV